MTVQDKFITRDQDGNPIHVDPVQDQVVMQGMMMVEMPCPNKPITTMQFEEIRKKSIKELQDWCDNTEVPDNPIMGGYIFANKMKEILIKYYKEYGVY
jgi:hypothetical protein